MASVRRRRGRKKSALSKDRLIQARVPETLENVLKEAAQKQRVSVSHLIRNILQDTLELVDTVVSSAEDFVGGSVEFAEQVRKDAGKIASTARGTTRATPQKRPEKRPEPDDEDIPESDPPNAETAALLERVLAWNQVVVNRPAICVSCSKPLDRGAIAHLGMTQSPADPPAWLCSDCLAKL